MERWVGDGGGADSREAARCVCWVETGRRAMQGAESPVGAEGGGGREGLRVVGRVWR